MNEIRISGRIASPPEIISPRPTIRFLAVELENRHAPAPRLVKDILVEVRCYTKLLDEWNGRLNAGDEIEVYGMLSGNIWPDKSGRDRCRLYINATEIVCTGVAVVAGEGGRIG